MNALVSALRTVARLFVDDGAFTAAIVTVIVLAGALAALLPAHPIVSGLVLLAGCLAVLFGSAVSAARRLKRL